MAIRVTKRTHLVTSGRSLLVTPTSKHALCAFRNRGLALTQTGGNIFMLKRCD